MKNLKNYFSLFLILLSTLLGQAQDYPDYFSWDNRFNTTSPLPITNYISSSKDQLVQGPCAAFAATALLEAAIQIYFNTPISDTEMNLSEQFIFSSCNSPDASPGALSAFNALDIIKNNGIGEESCFPYPEDFI